MIAMLYYFAREFIQPSFWASDKNEESINSRSLWLVKTGQYAPTKINIKR
jgi:hypothetical protein